MNKDFKTRQLNFLLQVIVLSLVFFGIHSYVLHYFLSDLTLFFPIWQIYVFHVAVTTLFYSVINYRFSNGQKDILMLFMGSTILKMFLAVLFLLPLLLSQLERKQGDIFNFFIPYFIYLSFEIYAITKFLQKS